MNSIDFIISLRNSEFNMNPFPYQYTTDSLPVVAFKVRKLTELFLIGGHWRETNQITDMDLWNRKDPQWDKAGGFYIVYFPDMKWEETNEG